MKYFVKSIVRRFLGPYSAYRIYTWAEEDETQPVNFPNDTFQVVPVEPSEIARCVSPLIQDQVNNAGPGSRVYACYEHGNIVSLCFYWFGDRYRQRNFVSLAPGEAKLVQIVTIPERRGHGAASRLIAESCRAMAKEGYHRMYARIWHSNTASIHAFERAGWRRAELILEFRPFSGIRPIRIKLKNRAAKSST